MIYELSIECSSKDVAEDIQEWVFAHFSCNEILWNAITEKKRYNEK